MKKVILILCVVFGLGSVVLADEQRHAFIWDASAGIRDLGYSLQSEDEGKQVYVKPGYRAKLWRRPNGTQQLASAVLSVSYILFPQRTEVKFKWERVVGLAGQSTACPP